MYVVLPEMSIRRAGQARVEMYISKGENMFLGIVIGTFIGAFLGVFIMALFTANKDK